jgi:hypothetical protein
METADEAGNAGNPATLTVPTPAIGVQIPQQIGTASTYRLTSRDVEQAFKFFSSASDGGRTVSKQDVHKYATQNCESNHNH